MIRPKLLLRKAVLAALAGAGAISARAEDGGVAIGATNAAGAYRFQGSFQVGAPVALAWTVLTDYEGIGRFVPSVAVSRVLSRKEGLVMLRQEARGRFLIFSRPLRLTLAVREHFPDRIDFEDVGREQFSVYEGAWRLTAGPAGTVVTYELTARPKPGLGPGFAARAAIRSGAARLLQQVRAEILRREDESLASGPAPGAYLGRRP